MLVIVREPSQPEVSDGGFFEDFQKYFEGLDPEEVYPNKDKGRAISTFYTDYCLSPNWKTGYNEVTFRKPLSVKNVQIFEDIKELDLSN